MTFSCRNINKRRAVLLCLIVLSQHLCDSRAFLPAISSSVVVFSRRSSSPEPNSDLMTAVPSRLQASSFSDRDRDMPPKRPPGEWKISNDFKMFLTQCSLQSFMFLLRQMRDPQTIYWLERFTQPALERKETNDTNYFTFSLPNDTTDNDMSGGGSDLKLKRSVPKTTQPKRPASGPSSFSGARMGAASYLEHLGRGGGSTNAPIQKKPVRQTKPMANSTFFGQSYLGSISNSTTFAAPASSTTTTTLAKMSTAVAPKTKKRRNKASWKEKKQRRGRRLVLVRRVQNQATDKDTFSTTDHTSDNDTSNTTDNAVAENTVTDYTTNDDTTTTENTDTNDAIVSNVQKAKEEEEQRHKRSSKLLYYHGLAAMNTTLFPSWEEFFASLLEQPTETFLVESSSAYIPDYELEIDPASLCSRILSVRDQISREFVKDLQVIADMGGHTLESYWETLKAMRADNSTTIGSGGTTDEQNEPIRLQRQNLLFLERNADSFVLDREPSPLRKGNFDLLVLLCTQEAIHRVLNDESRRHHGPEKITNDFLATFYTERLHYFSGIQSYGRADDFLEELLSCSPRVVITPEEENTKKGASSSSSFLIDPLRMAELVLEEREAVALDWKRQAEESPLEHMAIQKLRLNRMMGTQAVEEENESFQ